jgi:hypothetical protein
MRAGWVFNPPAGPPAGAQHPLGEPAAPADDAERCVDAEGVLRRSGPACACETDRRSPCDC